MLNAQQVFKIFCISFCKIKSNQNIFNILKGALAKNGSLAFAEGLACAVGAKANVPFVRLAKIVFKKCAMEKNKNTEALAFGSAV